MSATVESLRIPNRKPGPKPGHPHSGQFKKGVDLRRATPIKRNLMEQCAEAAQESAPKAIQFLSDVMEGEDQPVKVRLIAAKEILDRSIGQSVAMTVHREMSEQQNGDIQRLSNSPPVDLTDKQLLEVIQGQLAGPQVTTIEAEPTDVEFTESVVEQKPERRTNRPSNRKRRVRRVAPSGR